MLFYLVVTLFSFCSAYDNFQGLGRLRFPCFPTFDRSDCNETLVEAFHPTLKPASSNSPDTKLYLFTPGDRDRAEQLHECGGGLQPNSSYNPDCPTEVFVHGLVDGVCRSAWMREMKEQLYQRSDCYNVMLVDWTWGNSFDVAVIYNAKVVGEQLAYVLKKIARQTGYDCKKFHIVGHSYGSTVASYAGKFMRKACKLGRITGLDPALPPFKYSPEKELLNPTDALLVESVHSNGGECFPTLGDSRPLGHINFYMNDGTNQYACYPYALKSFLKLDILYAAISILLPNYCFHLQALQYYKASILADTDGTFLIGVQCDTYEDWLSGKCERNCEREGNCLPMGLDTPNYVDYSDLSVKGENRKVYYVPTTLSCPYSDHSGFTGLPLKPVNKQDPPT